MNPKLRPSLAIAACSLALSGAALAGMSPAQAKFTQADVNESGTLDRAEFATTLKAGLAAKKVDASFKKADLNLNGFVSAIEYRIYERELQRPSKTEIAFDVADSNDDGQVDRAEYFTVKRGKRSWVAAYREYLLTDSMDSFFGISYEEWSGKRKKAQKGTLLAFDLSDRDVSDTVDLEEFTLNYPVGTKMAKMSVKFAKLDRNGDVKLDRSEWNPGGPKPGR